MKRRILLAFTVCFLISAQQANAQSEKEISIGFRAGYANTILHGSEVRHQQYNYNKATVIEKDGFEVAVAVYYQIKNQFFLTSGLGFIQKGGAVDNPSLLYPFDITLNYLNIPLGLAFRPVQSDRFSIFAEAGFVMNYEISSEQEFKKGISSESEDSKFIVAYAYGGSLRYRLNQSISLQSDFKFLGDINSFYERTLGDRNLDLKTKGTTVSFGVVYRMR